MQFIFTDTRAFIKNVLGQEEADFRLDKIIRDLSTIHRSNDKVMIIGHSIHAFMALEYAYQFPNKVNHLVLIALSPIAEP